MYITMCIFGCVGSNRGLGFGLDPTTAAGQKRAKIIHICVEVGALVPDEYTLTNIFGIHSYKHIWNEMSGYV